MSRLVCSYTEADIRRADREKVPQPAGKCPLMVTFRALARRANHNLEAPVRAHGYGERSLTALALNPQLTRSISRFPRRSSFRHRMLEGACFSYRRMRPVM